LRHAFTLVELLVSMAVLTLLILLIAQLFNGASAVTALSSKHMDADAQARAVFDRMAVDFAQMVKRTDVDYFLKDSTNTQAGNDQLAFYSQVPGYYPSSGAPSPVSLVAYRISNDNTGASFNKLQRLGCGLVWNGVSLTDTPIVFLPSTIAATWPTATNMAADTNYELAGPQIFRMEYSYLLKGQTIAGTSYDSILSAIPWDSRITGHTAVNGMQDVAAITVAIAVVDPKSRVLISDTQLTALAASMNDFPAAGTPKPGDLEAQWQTAINSAAIPRIAASAVRVYRRCFYLPPTLTTNP
jgi:prepilin-type N-terminal cleavage/methylation domain-containing protein